MPRLRIAIVGQSPCQLCHAACCKQNGHAYAAILSGDEIRKFAAFSVDARIADAGRIVIEKVLAYRDGRCQFLGEDDRCTIYADRPAACRAFQCINAFDPRGHDTFLQRNPRVLNLLETL